MKRLQKIDLIYLHILYVVWQLVDYYSVLFRVDAGEDPAKIPARIMQEENGVTYVRFMFPKIDEERKFSVLEMLDIYNDYLRIKLLPEQDLLKPFCNGIGIYDMMEALYVNKVYEIEGYLYLEVVYIDNTLAFNYVRNKEKEISI